MSSLGVQARRRSDSPSISADGSFFASRSRAGNLVADDRNGAQDVFVRDLQTGVTERVSVGSSGEEGTKTSAEPSISADGRFVAFKSAAPNLVQGDSNRVADIFVHNRASGNDVFVRNRGAHQTRRVSVTSAGAEGRRGGHDPVISANGRFVVFESYSLAYPGDRKREDVFVRDRRLRKTRQVSVSFTGAPGNRHSSSPTISADGRFAAFESGATDLVAGDTNRSGDIFVRGPLSVAPVTPRRSRGRRSGRRAPRS